MFITSRDEFDYSESTVTDGKASRGLLDERTPLSLHKVLYVVPPLVFASRVARLHRCP